MTTETPPALIHARLAAVLAAVRAITKDRKNTAQDFKFRGIDDVYNELHGLFAKHEIYALPEILEWKQAERPTKNGGQQLHTVVKMRYRFTTTDGSERITETPGEAADTGDKGLGKACQYAYKLALLQMFLIPTEGDNDPDASGTEWASVSGEWIKRIATAKVEAELDAVIVDLRKAHHAGQAPDPESAPGLAIGDAIDAQRDKLNRRRT